ncbi:4-hydroxyphenylacetate 3-hydroxylase N-terminal domain-containing protein [Streptomyces sp. NPDC047000]|uniref:4-hydroxyphenylacetate 3-hydroxylase family protein n=1 Tax=Streptomyces sp. NPDC047000 TaxID=3155474 RepID=UPI003401A4A0
MRTGADYLAGLSDGRCVLFGGERVKDVTRHPATAPIAHTVATMFDFAADPANEMIYTAPETGREANRAFMTPRSTRDLRARREAHVKWAGLTQGFVGRSPDHVPSTIAAMAAHRGIFDEQSTAFGDNITRFYRRVLDESLFLAYAIIPPQVSRDTLAGGWGEDFLQVGVVSSDDAGVTVRGSAMLATSAAVADELFVSCIKPLKPEDKDFAVSFAVPMATEGLKLLERRPYAPGATSVYDYPLTSRYDETDALAVFEDVFVPWDRVFVDRDPRLLHRSFQETGAHVLANWQAQARLSVKLDFLLGIAHRIASMNRVDTFPGVVEKLGELAGLAASVTASLHAAEYDAVVDADGFAVPSRPAVYGQVSRQADLYPRVIHTIRDLCGGGVLQVPSGIEDMHSPLTRPVIDRYVVSPGVPAEERIKLMRLAWDVIGSEFAGRHQQYEMFYNGAPFLTKMWAYQQYDYAAAVRRVDGFLAEYDLDTRLVTSAVPE